MEKIQPLQTHVILIAPLIDAYKRYSNRITKIVSENLRKNRETHREGTEVINNNIGKIRRACRISANSNHNHSLHASLFSAHTAFKRSAR